MPRIQSVSIQSVVDKWASGYAWKSGTGSLHTDGQDLYSYNLKIGYTDDQGKKVAIDYTAPGKAFYSQTTSKHVTLAKSVSDRVQGV